MVRELGAGDPEDDRAFVPWATADGLDYFFRFWIGQGVDPQSLRISVAAGAHAGLAASVVACNLFVAGQFLGRRVQQMFGVRNGGKSAGAPAGAELLDRESAYDRRGRVGAVVVFEHVVRNGGSQFVAFSANFGKPVGAASRCLFDRV